MKIECTIDNKHVLLTVNSNKPLNLILMDELETSHMETRCRDGNCGNYQKSRFWHDLERAYEDTGSHPCPHCYASKTLIFESLLQTVVKSESGPSHDEEPDETTIVREVGLNKCPCLDAHEILDIFRAAAAYRRRRRVRRY